MAEPLKNMFSRSLVEPFVAEVMAVWPEFPQRNFLHHVFDENWESLELKQRVRHLSLCLRRHLPAEYPAALEILVDVARRYIARQGEKLTFEYTFLPDFVENHGVEYPDHSIPALETLTRWSSAEFAVRPFLLRYPARMHAQMLEWSQHESPMVRRLSSEGIRPRLPWGMGVPMLKKDPSPILPILENLKNDPAETVRRSVANNLNDIAKDHPQLVLSIAERWLGQTAATDWVVRHACRGLLKKGNAAALAHFGFEQGVAGVEISGVRFSENVSLGGRFECSFEVKNTGTDELRLRLEYGVDYQTLSGKISTKVFNIKTLQLAPQQSESLRRHLSFQDLTTRKHYPGPHRWRILVNGAEMAAYLFMVS
ncbi:MAG: DNA alkylation repair protein [Saprospiraceae bacterium]|nr:DNA alkylation repair protein [Saprospiraceae bacterium]